MALNLKIKPKVAAIESAPAAFTEDPEAPLEQPSPTQAPAKPQASKPVAKSAGMSFLKRGKEAQVTLAQEDAKAEMKLKNNTRRFYIPKGKNTQVTFLDGDVKDGMLDIPYFHQHTVFMNGNYNNWFICTADDEPCPICEGSAEQPDYVGALTVIDHSEYTAKDGKVYKNQIKLFVAKRNSLKLLLKKALKQNGLAGCTFDVSRNGDKSPSVGDDFDFTSKRTLAQLNAAYGTKEQVIKPINMDETLKGMYMSANDLRKLGFGNTGPAVGSEAAPAEDYEDVL